MTNTIKRARHSRVSDPQPKSCLKQTIPCVSDDDDSLSTCSTTSLKSVSFDTIEINSIPMELGDNPSAQGVPVTLGWEADRTDVYDLEDYENFKPEPRATVELHLTPSVRFSMISSSGGHTSSEIVAAINEAKKIKISRARSIKNKKWDGLNMAYESVKRKVAPGRSRRASLTGGMPSVSPKEIKLSRRPSL